MPRMSAEPVLSPVLDAFRLDGKVAIVTGASSGLGVAFATGLAEAGADVAICARRVEKLEQTKQQVEALGRRCLAVPVFFSSRRRHTRFDCDWSSDVCSSD